MVLDFEGLSRAPCVYELLEKKTTGEAVEINRVTRAFYSRDRLITNDRNTAITRHLNVVFLLDHLFTKLPETRDILFISNMRVHVVICHGVLAQERAIVVN